MRKPFLLLLVFCISTLSLAAETVKWEYLVLSLGKTYFKSLPSDPAYVSPNLGFKSPAYMKDGFYNISEATITQHNLDILGKNGWELIDIVGIIGGDQQYVFKRPLKPEIYDKTLKTADEVYNKYVDNLKKPKDVIPILDNTKLIEYDAYQAELEKQRITQKKEEYISLKLSELNKYKLTGNYLSESTNEYVPDMLSIYIDATEALIFNGNKYKQSDAKQLAKEAKEYFNKIFNDKFIVYVGIDILFNGETTTVVDPYK